MNREQRNATRTAQFETPMQTWVKFRLKHPYSKDEFSADAEKLTKWRYHNVARMAEPELKTIAIDNADLLEIRKRYRVSRYEDFPDFTKAIYNSIARCFAGFQVYACGSRVRGDYIDPDHPEFLRVNYARKKAMMKPVTESDFDFWVEPGAIQVKNGTPSHDRARLRIPEKEKVAIPIHYER